MWNYQNTINMNQENEEFFFLLKNKRSKVMLR